MSQETPIHWRNVFDVNKKLHGLMLDEFVQKVMPLTGYKYFLWNERVYKVIRSADSPGQYTCVDTGFTIEDLGRYPSEYLVY